jgi:uncharacterized protein with HEPN domain
MAYRNISVWLEDILIALEKIRKYTAGITSFEEYSKNFMVRDATERNLEIISEALKNAEKLQPSIPISDIPQIIGLRNIINHQYFEVEHEIIWLIIQTNLPVLETEVKKILDDYERRLELNEL